MRVRVGRLVVYALIGLIVTPIVVFYGMATLLYAFNPMCRSGGDSGSCAMGALGMATGSAVPAAVLGAAVALWRDWRASRKIP